jgi:hypothetical protein
MTSNRDTVYHGTLIWLSILGVLLETEKDKKFANFSIFDDTKERYSTFKFQYEPKTFDRLHELMKFNTRLNIDLIKEKIASHVNCRRNYSEQAQS